MNTPLSSSNLNSNESLSPRYDGIDDDILDNLDEQLEHDPAFQVWVNQEDKILNETDEERVWVPLSMADLTHADRLAQTHPDRFFAELIRQNTLAAVALSNYLDSHGVAIDPDAAHHRQAVLQLLNPTADVVLSHLGKLEALIVQSAEDSVTGQPNFTPSSFEIGLDPGTLAYVVITLEQGGAWLQGVMLSHDLRQDWPEGGAIPLAMMKSMSSFWDAYSRWQKYQQITASCSEQQGWSAELRTEAITMLNFAYEYCEPHQQAMVLARFLNERTEELTGTETFQSSAIQGNAVDWLDVAMDWLDELEEWDAS